MMKYFRDPQGAYHYFRVYTDGEVLYSQMIDILIKTQMNLKYYPFNILNISLDVESYGYPNIHLGIHLEYHQKIQDYKLK